jgi:threonine dehydratase
VSDWQLERDLERSFRAAVETRERIAAFVDRTPLFGADDGRRLLKLESLQRTGSFKIRGAASAITAAGRPREIVAASTGNHGLAVAAVARTLEIPCRIFVPATAAGAKLARLRQAGVELVSVDGDPLRAELAAREACDGRDGVLLVPPYNDRQVVLGQATLGLELLDDLGGEAPDAVFAAVGGGGLIAGLALALRTRWPRCRIVGCLPAASPAMAEAVAAGAVLDSPLRPTLADATAGNIEATTITLPICAALVDEWQLIEETEIAAAMRSALFEHRLEIEGAAAVALAASLRHDDGGRHLVVLGGGNVGAQTLRTITSSHRRPAELSDS